MNKYFFFSFLAVSLLAFISCNKDDEVDAISLNTEVTISNTLQTAADPSMGGTGGVETPIETVFGLPSGALEITTTVTNRIEFTAYLDGLYDIDLSENRINYELVAPADHPVYANFFRTIEANTFDRYYFEFAEAHNIQSGESSNSSVTLRVLSSTRIQVEISEGFDFNPGTSFSIDLKN